MRTESGEPLLQSAQPDACCLQEGLSDNLSFDAADTAPIIVFRKAPGSIASQIRPLILKLALEDGAANIILRPCSSFPRQPCRRCYLPWYQPADTVAALRTSNTCSTQSCLEAMYVIRQLGRFSRHLPCHAQLYALLWSCQRPV